MRIPHLQNVDLAIVDTFLGYKYVPGLDSAYVMTRLEDVIVYKVNIAINVFSEIVDFSENINFGDIYFLELLFTGIIPIQNFNIKKYYDTNTKFRNYINELYYIKFTTAPDNFSFYYILVNDIRNRYNKYKTKLLDQITGPHCVIADTGMQVYFYCYRSSVDKLVVPKLFYKEVVSLA